MRQAIVDAVCRQTGRKDEGYADEEGNVVDVLVQAGFAPDVVIEACANVSKIPIVEARWLAGTPSWPDIFDVDRCRRLGLAPVAWAQERWQVAYVDPERALAKSDAGLPEHRACLALSQDLIPFFDVGVAKARSARPPATLPYEEDPFAPRETLVSVLDGDAEGPGTEEEAVFDDSVGDADSVISPGLLRLASAEADQTFADDGEDPAEDSGEDAFDEPEARPSAPPSGRTSAPTSAPPSAPPSAPIRGANRSPPPAAGASSGDDDLDLYVDTSDRLPGVEGSGSDISRPRGLRQPSPPPPSPSPPRQSTQETVAPRRPSTTSGEGRSPTVDTVAPPSVRMARKKPSPSAADARGPAQPPAPLRVPPRRYVLAALAVLLGVGGAIFLVRIKPQPVVAGPAGVVEDGRLVLSGAQAELLQAAVATTDDDVAVRILSKAFALDPETQEGRDALLARAKRLVKLGRRGQAERDLDRLKRRDDVVDHGEALKALQVGLDRLP